MKRKYVIGGLDRKEFIIDDHILGLFLSFDYKEKKYSRVLIRFDDYLNLEFKEDGMVKVMILSDNSYLANALADFEVKNDEA